jgi:hypothetical protein
MSSLKKLRPKSRQRNKDLRPSGLRKIEFEISNFKFGIAGRNARLSRTKENELSDLSGHRLRTTKER